MIFEKNLLKDKPIPSGTVDLRQAEEFIKLSDIGYLCSRFDNIPLVGIRKKRSSWFCYLLDIDGEFIAHTYNLNDPSESQNRTPISKIRTRAIKWFESLPKA